MDSRGSGGIPGGSGGAALGGFWRAKDFPTKFFFAPFFRPLARPFFN